MQKKQKLVILHQFVQESLRFIINLFKKYIKLAALHFSLTEYVLLCLYSRLSIIIEQICVSCGYDSNFIAHERTNVSLE